MVLGKFVERRALLPTPRRVRDGFGAGYESKNCVAGSAILGGADSTPSAAAVAIPARAPADAETAINAMLGSSRVLLSNLLLLKTYFTQDGGWGGIRTLDGPLGPILA